MNRCCELLAALCSESYYTGIEGIGGTLQEYARLLPFPGPRVAPAAAQ